MTGQSASRLSAKCRVVEDAAKGGYGIAAAEPIAKGEPVCVWGGRVVDGEELAALPAKEREHALQVEEGFYLASLAPDEPPSYFNHSCDPNAGFNGQIVLVAMRDIAPGEEVTFDYAMCDSSPYDEFVCRCGSRNCRGKVTGNDWRNPELWERYDGYFSPYLQRPHPGSG
jgi:uncharacterized protein